MKDKTERRIRMGMVGGGLGAFIGPVQRMGAELDGRIELVAGAFSRDPEKSRQSGRMYGIAPERAYSDYREMMERERSREDAMDFVCIVTPNDLHVPVAVAAMEQGFHVVSDKPAAASLEGALELEDVVCRTGRLYALTYTYTGYPMVREARKIVRGGSLGEVRKVVVNYSQGWLIDAIEKGSPKQAAWRSDPRRSGAGGASADIGVHALNLMEYVTGRRVTELCAAMSSLPGRKLDDDCNVLLRLDNGAPGVIVLSQIAAGERNNVRLDVYGEKGGLHWSHEKADRLALDWLSQPHQTLHAATEQLTEETRKTSRMPPGHPEGVIEAFGNIYRDFAAAVCARFSDPAAQLTELVPGIDDGVRGMAFIDRAIASSAQRAGWLPFDIAPASGASSARQR